MSLYAFQENAPTISLGSVGNTDIMPINQGGILKQAPCGTLQEAPRTLTTGTTAANLQAFGITVLQTSAGSFTLNDPLVAGLQTEILFPASTGTRTVTCAAATINGSTVSPSSAQVLTMTGTSNNVSGSVALVAQSTSKWHLLGVVGPVVSS